MKKVFTILAFLLATPVVAHPTDIILPKDYVVPSDTTQWGEELDEDEENVEKPTNRNLATEFNALDYQLEKRYIPTGETFRKGWKKNLFVEMGVGIQRIEPQATENYEIEPISNFALSVGTHLDHLHGLRLTMNYGMGYQRMKNEQMYKAGAALDHLYNLSAYLNGYNTTRMANVSSILGVGLERSWFRGGESDMSFNAHVGAQIKFYTGPHAYLTVEPYIGLAGDQIDLSRKRNWRGYDIFYGANIGMVYYLRNNLSPESRQRIIENRLSHNEMSEDSVLMAWQQPWLFQLGAGLAFTSSERLNMAETMGSEMVFSVGKWLSPVIGLRGSLASRTTTWNKRVTAADPKAYHPEYHEELHSHYKSARLEVMLNPMGFFDSFNWQSRFGFYLVGGAELGQLHKMQEKALRTYSETYGGGVNLWWQPTKGLKLFAEPRFSHSIYRIPYSNVDWHSRYSDNNISMDLGVAVELRDTWRWQKEASMLYQYVEDPEWRLTFGLAGGTNLTQTKTAYSEGSSLGFNGQFFALYHLNRTSSVRLGAEFISLKRTNVTDFNDFNMEVPDADYAPVSRYGLWEHKYSIIAISPAYEANLNQLMYGYQADALKVHGFVGPTLFLRMKPESTLSPSERIMTNHVVELKTPNKMAMNVGAHLGLRLDYRLNRHFGVFASPTVYWVNNLDLPGMNINELNLMGTLNIGVQYNIMQRK